MARDGQFKPRFSDPGFKTGFAFEDRSRILSGSSNPKKKKTKGKKGKKSKR